MTEENPPTNSSEEPTTPSSRGLRVLLFAVGGAALLLVAVWLVVLRGRGAPAPATAADGGEPAVVIPADETTAVSAIFRNTTHLTLDRIEDIGGGGLRAHATLHGSPQGSSVVGVGTPEGTPKDVLRGVLLAELGSITAPLVRRGVREVDVQVELIVESAGKDKRVIIEEDRVNLAAAPSDVADDGGVDRLAPLLKELRSEWSKYELREEPAE